MDLMKKINNEQKFVILLFFLSLIIRLVIAPFHVSLTLPIDFHHYIDAGRTLLEGKTLYVDYSDKWGPPNKGPLFAVIIAIWIGIFGEDFGLLKTPAILFDSLTVVLIFYIVKEIVNVNAAKYASIFYSFSYVALLSSAVVGNNDNYYLFFMVLSLYLLIRSKPSFKLSAVSLGIGAGIGIQPMLIGLPLISYYIYQKEGFRRVLTYCTIFAATFAIILLPFVMKSGLYPFYHNYFYIPAIFGTTLQAFIRYISSYFIYGPYNSPGDYVPVIRGENALIETISFPLIASGYILTFLYILKFKILDKKLELVRNIFLLTLAIFVFGRAMDVTYFIMIIPFAIIIIVSLSKNHDFTFSAAEVTGIILSVLSIYIYAYIYRWEKLPRYTDLELLLLLFSIFIAAIGTYLTMIKFEFVKTWSFVIFANAIVANQHTRFLYLLGPIIPQFQDRMLTWGIFYIFSIVLFLAAMVLLFINMHRFIKTTSKSQG